jgi:nicotinamidase-related amidase
MKWWATIGTISIAAATAAAFAYGAAHADTIVDEWNSVKAPPAPQLKPVTIDPKTTALLLLDFVPQTCNEKRRPRCLASLAPVAKLLGEARKAGAMVVYSGVGSSPKSQILKPVAPRADEPFVQSHADKFRHTDLEKILKDHGIKTVIVTGTAAEGAVLYTGSAAAFLGLNVIVPVEGLSSSTTYAEQYVTWNLANAPGVGQKVTLTSIGMIKF